MQPFRIAILGLWHLGEIYSAGLAELGHKVVGISEDEELIANFKKGELPLPEPDLKELIIKNQSEGRLRYSADFSEIAQANVLWLAFDTPVSDADEADLSPIWDALKKSLPHLSTSALLIVSSQIPVGTSEEIRDFVRRSRSDLKLSYLYIPENLRLGEALRSFMEPGRIVVGGYDLEAFKKARLIFSKLQADFLEMSPASAEMAKHALNAFLATSVSFINDIADLCEKTGADILDVARALRSEPRIGPKAFLDAGLGFSGGTLGRDLRALLVASKKFNSPTPVIASVLEKNLSRKNLIIHKISEVLGGLGGKKIALLGLTYKPGTRTLRRSRAIEIAQALKDAGASLRLSDPEVEEPELSALGRFDFSRNPYESVLASEAVVLITPWPVFKNLDFKKLGASVKPQAVFFDTSNFLWDKEREINAAGFRYLGIGRKN